jgi:hypothetical protein
MLSHYDCRTVGDEVNQKKYSSPCPLVYTFTSCVTAQTFEVFLSGNFIFCGLKLQKSPEEPNAYHPVFVAAEINDGRSKPS